MDMIRIKAILAVKNRGYAFALADAITEKAKSDADYAAALAEWLDQGGTVLLRDRLCRPFENAAFIALSAGHFRYPWDECWTALDSARATARSWNFVH